MKFLLNFHKHFRLLSPIEEEKKMASDHIKLITKKLRKEVVTRSRLHNKYNKTGQTMKSKVTFIAEKVPVFGVILVRIFPHWD